MTRRLFSLILMFVCFAGSIQAQLSGVINQYTPVTAISCNTVDVVFTNSFAVGDRVLIIQMKGAEINTSNSPAFGSVVNYHDCGNYEFAVISAISGNTITFQYQLLHSYDASGRVQLIRVPQYTNATVSNTLTAQAWDGSSGGVLVMEVSGTLTLNANISVTGKGFRGSFLCANPDGGCGNNVTNYFYNVSSGLGAQKGEGIAEVPASMSGGRGALANGGGGGNKHNSGGGGGSNATFGGRGGDEASFCSSQPIGGEGGVILDYSLGKIFMGGGGGSPDHNDNVGTSGSNGGGIVIIRAANMVSNNFVIEANGEHVPLLSNSIGDGSGGGGAGGVVILEVPAFSGTLWMEVNGGNGGDQQTGFPSCFGPGGGGGAGMVLLAQSMLSMGMGASFVPGLAGVDQNNSAGCNSPSHGATHGQVNGNIINDIVLPESTQSSGGIDLGPDIESCETSAVLDPGQNFQSYQWSTGATTPTITVTNSGTYWLTVNSGNTNCGSSDTVSVTLNGITVDAGADQGICAGQSTVLQATSTQTNQFSWDQGVNDGQVFTPQTTAVYTVSVMDPITGCTDTDDVLITVNPLPEIAVSALPASGCVPFTVTLINQTTNCSGAVWTFSNGTVIQGAGNQQLTFDTPGCYDLTFDAVSVFGCTASANFPSLVCALPLPIASFLPDPLILNSDNPSTTMINQSVDGVHYEWDFGDGTGFSDEFDPTHTYSSDVFTPYTIRLKVTNEHGCTAIASGKVYMEGGLIYYVPNSFTPDGNQFNAVFLPVFTEGFDTQNYHFSVFNRWGELVFETTDPLTGWDGSYRGSLAQEGTYTWSILVKIPQNAERKLFHGHLNLLR